MPRSIRIHYHRPDRGTTVFVEYVVLDTPHVRVTLLDTYDGRECAPLWYFTHHSKLLADLRDGTKAADDEAGVPPPDAS